MKRAILSLLVVLCVTSSALAAGSFERTDSERLTLIFLPYGTVYNDFEYRVEGTSSDSMVIYDFHRAEGFIRNYYNGWDQFATMEAWSTTCYYSNGNSYDGRVYYSEYEYASSDWLYASSTKYWGGKKTKLITGASAPRHADNEITWYVAFDPLTYDFNEFTVRTDLNL